jgi:hypothetical protein
LADGFHAFEAELGFRWTDGDAVLDKDHFAGFAGGVEVVLHVDRSTRYIDDGKGRLVA